MSNDQPTAAADKFSNQRAYRFASPFILVGVSVLGLGLYDLLTRQLNAATGKPLLIIIVACTGIALAIIGWFASKRIKPEARLKASHPDKPWMWRKDWAAGRSDNSNQRSNFLLWVAVVVFNLVCLVAVVIFLHGVRHGSAIAWCSLIFPAVGVAMLGFAIKTTRSRSRFGRSAFAMNKLPYPPGGVIAGELRVPVRLEPEQAFYLRLSCLRRTPGQRGKTRIITERILWQDEKWFRPNLPQPVPGVTSLPVFFQPPAGLPESTIEPRDGVQWRLEASAKVRGPDFHGIFEVPVFKAAEAPTTLPAATAADPAVGAAPAPGTDPTLPYQLTLDEVRQEIQSRIQIVDQPGGREFIFPAGRNPAFTMVAGGLWLVWTTAIILMVVWHTPFLFPLIFTVVNVLMSLFLFDLWLRRSCVVVTPGQVKISTSWLAYKKETSLAASEVTSLKADLGATAGHTAYYDLKFRTRKGRDVIAAKFLNYKPEADWLVREMVAGLKRPAEKPEAR